MSATMVTVEYMNQMLAEQRRLFTIELEEKLAEQRRLFQIELEQKLADQRRLFQIELQEKLAEQRQLFQIELQEELVEQRRRLDAHWSKILAEQQKTIVKRFQHSAREGIEIYSTNTDRGLCQEVAITECSICLGPDSNCRTKCQHDFHVDCIHQWIDSCSYLCLTCPMCREFLYE